VDMVPRDLGCMRSHMKALDYARRQKCPVHIMEDDSILSARVRPFLNSPEAAALLERWDILFLDMWVDGHTSAITRYQAAMRATGPMDLVGTRVAGTSSYVVSPRSAGKLLKLLKEAPPPIDCRYNDFVQQKIITAAVMVPFLTGADIELGTHSI